MPASDVEFVIQGPRGWTLGFIQGFLHVQGKLQRVLDAEAAGFDCKPLREKIQQLLNPGVAILHLLAPQAAAADVRRAIEAAAALGEDVTLRHEQTVRSARFSFDFTVYSKKHAERLRRLFKALPEGIELKGDFKESIAPDAKGIEAYAPVHDYELRGYGTVEGPVAGVLVLYRPCREEELVKCGPAELIHEEPSS